MERRNITVRVCRSAAEEEAADRQFWKSLTPAERIDLTWQLSEELWRLKGEFHDDPAIQPQSFVSHNPGRRCGRLNPGDDRLPLQTRAQQPKL